MRYVRFWGSVGLLLAVGMVPGPAQEKKPVEPVVYQDAHYPLRVGDRWQYRATVNDAPAQKVIVTVDRVENYEYKFTLDKKPETSEVVKRFRLKVVSGSKELTEHVGVLRDGAYRFSTAGKETGPPKEITPPLRFLKLPFMKGDSWTVHSTSEGALVSGTFKSEEDTVKLELFQVQVPTFQAIHVITPDLQLGARNDGDGPVVRSRHRPCQAERARAQHRLTKLGAGRVQGGE